MSLPRRVGAAAAGFLAVAAAATGLPAQQAGKSASAWIGVGISDRPACPAAADRPAEIRPDRDDSAGARAPDDSAPGCHPVYVAETVVVGGPADQAGLEPGDTLLSVEGHPLGSEAGERVLAGLEAGRPVRVAVAREGGRRTLRVTPATWPSGSRLLRVRVADTGLDEGGVLRIRVHPMRPSAPGAAGGRLFRLASPPGAPEGATVFAWSSGDSGRQAPWSTWQGRMDDSLTRRLEIFQDSVLAEARVRMDSLRQAYRQWARSSARRNAALASGRGIARLAGAEFRPLTPELAEYFEGADRGLLVLRVLPGTPAGMLGLRAGDVVVRAAGRRVHDGTDLRAALVGVAPRDSVVVQWVRKGKTMTGVLEGH
ncbi:MAG TPA: PDZ domain-containing protein [Gemmatimonadota bacterium]|nr:PDZ domain-containing protein [Gemmatimonadota bacterium]